jgi:hypothetical protein
MGALTDAGENLLLNWVCGRTATQPTTLYLALETAAGSDSSNGTEVSGGSYARQPITFGSNAASGSISNTQDIVFTGMPAATVVSGSVWSASTGSTGRLWYGNLTASKTLNAGDTFTVSTGSLTLSLD